MGNMERRFTLANGKERGKRPLGDLDTLVDKVGAAVRESVDEDELTEDVDTLVSKVSEAVRDVMSKERLPEDADSLAERVSEAVIAAISENRPKKDADAIIDKINRTVRSAVSSGSEAAGSMRERIQFMLEGVRGTGRDSVVMVRINKESRDRMDQLIETELVGSRSEAAALLIAEGIKARQDLFDRISAKIEAIRKAKAELHRLLNEPDTL